MTEGGVGAILRARVPTGTVTFAGDALSITFMTAGWRRVQMDDKPREACGLFGIYAPGEDVSRISFFGLFALQHRGQESAGIAASDGNRISVHTRMGLVAQAFDEESLSKLTGHLAIGHTRYSTTGSSRIDNAQPMLVNGPWGEVALGHNGNVINAQELRIELEERGVQFKGSSDTEVMAHWLGQAPGATWPERIRYCMNRFQGAYSLVLMTKDKLIAIRDPMGVRPLSLGKLNGGWVIASESSALDHIGSDVIREIEPGEAVIIDETGVTSHQLVERDSHSLCIFEHIYFARPDSIVGGKLLHSARQRMGAQLAREYPVEADMVIGVPRFGGGGGDGIRQGVGDPVWRGAPEESVCRQDVHPAGPAATGVGGTAQVQCDAGSAGGEEDSSGGRQHSPGHDDTPCGQSAEKKRGQGNTHEDMCPAYPTPVLLRCRPCDARRASGGS